MTYYVENLSVFSWVLIILPRLVIGRFVHRNESIECYAILGSRSAMAVARLTRPLFRGNVNWLHFNVMEIRGNDGLFIHMRIQHRDLVEIQHKVTENDLFQAAANIEAQSTQMRSFLSKRIVSPPLYDRKTFGYWDAVYLIEVCRYKSQNQERDLKKPSLFFMQSRPWFEVIQEYASKLDVRLFEIKRTCNLPIRIRRSLPLSVVTLIRWIRYRRAWIRYPHARNSIVRYLITNYLAKFKMIFMSLSRSPDYCGTSGRNPEDYRVDVPYMGHLNVNNPEKHSDLFFWQQSELDPQDLQVSFSYPGHPLNEDKLEQLKSNDISVAVLHPGATTVDVPVYCDSVTPKKSELIRRITKGKGLEGKWLKDQIEDYEGIKSYWSSYFRSNNIKVSTTWWKNDATHCAISAALSDLGGISTIYQRSLEVHPNPALAIDADVVFGFSAKVAELETLVNSNIGYHVATGYLGDHRFKLLKDRAGRMRNNLASHGATRIMAFADQATTDDIRWGTGHEFAKEEALFLCGKVISEPWFGLVIKSKMPSTFRSRLDVAERNVLELAESTGRCHVYESVDDALGAEPPCEAALVADVAVDGTLRSSSAAMESVLAGVPTLLMDREGWGVSPMYGLGVGKVVFNDFDNLWRACIEQWSTPGGMHGFGDWSIMLDDLDPFRDGRGAERMGTYLKWLIEGFKSGWSRDYILAMAAERYSQMWGNDKITSVGTAH